MKNFAQTCIVIALFFAHFSAGAQNMKAIDNSLNYGKVEWLSRQISAGKVPFGEPVSREFEVKNISNESLYIIQVKSSCHCTVTEWSKDPVAPGETTKIKVTYDSAKEGDFYRIVTVTTNFDTAQSVPLALTGKVDPAPPISSNQ